MEKWFTDHKYDGDLWDQLHAVPPKIDSISDLSVRKVFLEVTQKPGFMYFSRDGLYVAKSTITGANLGLFGMRTFSVGEYITTFAGLRYKEDEFDQIWSQIPEIYRKKSRYIISNHAIVIDPTDEDGSLILPWWNENVAPYVNQPPVGISSNCRAVSYSKNADGVKRAYPETVLEACRAINIFDEIFMVYQSMGITPIPLYKDIYEIGFNCEGTRIFISAPAITVESFDEKILELKQQQQSTAAKQGTIDFSWDTEEDMINALKHQDEILKNTDTWISEVQQAKLSADKTPLAPPPINPLLLLPTWDGTKYTWPQLYVRSQFDVETLINIPKGSEFELNGYPVSISTFVAKVKYDNEKYGKVDNAGRKARYIDLNSSRGYVDAHPLLNPAKVNGVDVGCKGKFIRSQFEVVNRGSDMKKSRNVITVTKNIPANKKLTILR